MSGNSYSNEIFAVCLEELKKNNLFIGELIPRNNSNPDEGYFGRTFITYDGTHTFTEGKNRNEVERKSTELVRFTIDYFIDDLKEARMFQIANGPLTGFS